MKTIQAITVICALLVVSASVSLAADRYSFKKGQLVAVSSGKLCGLIGNKWTPVKKVGTKYQKDSGGGSRCATLLKTSSFKDAGLNKLPSAASLMKGRKDVSGAAATAPAVKQIPNSNVENLFWGTGLIGTINTGEPTSEQCDEFFKGSSDPAKQGAGLLGCYSVQGIGYSFQSILEGGGSACFMRNIPTRANLNSGGVSVSAGSLPSGDITQLFEAPSGSIDRVVKVQISGMGQDETGFIKVNSAATNAAKGLQYGYTLWFCSEGQTQANNYETTSVSLAGEFKYDAFNLQDGHQFRNQITAFLTNVSGSIAYDLTRDRRATISGEFGGSKFKSQVVVKSDNTIATKVRDTFSVGEEDFTRKSFSLASFAGSSLSNFRVNSAAMKEDLTVPDPFNPGQSRTDSREVGIDFDEEAEKYVQAPSLDLLAGLDTTDLDSSFFDSDAEVNPNLSGKSCSASSDVTLSMNFSVPSMQAIASKCNNERLGDMDFCRGDAEVNQAMATCFSSPPSVN